MSDTVQFTVDLTIEEGRLAAFEETARAMVAGIEKEPGALAYDWYLSDDRKRCRLIELYADADAVLAHLTGPVVNQLVPKILETSRLDALEVYGDPGPKAAEILAGFGATIFQPWHRLAR